MKRIGIIAFLQESNTFLTGKTTFQHFERELLCVGEEIRKRFATAHHEVGGFFTELEGSEFEIVPIFAARALPYGVIEQPAFDEILSRMMAQLDRVGPVDGLLVAPHGATVAEHVPDADGYWLSEVRKRVGQQVPIMGTLDLHANVSPKMIAACDTLIGYRTNPHLDQKQRGRDAARILMRTLRGEIRPTMAASFPPFVVNIERQATAEPHCQAIYQYADEQLKKPKLLSNSVILGFPYADVPEMGATVIAVTDNDPTLAQVSANELALYWWNRRHEFVGQLIDVPTAVQRAAQLSGPVCLLDMGDNVGGGSPGDGTLIAHELHKTRLGPSFVCLADAGAAQQAANSGVGARVRLTVGGKIDNIHGPPLEGDFTVKGIYDGKFTESEPRHGGITSFDQGLTAIVTSDIGLTFMLTTKRMVPFSINQLTACGLDPTQFQVLVAKGVHAPVAAYAPVSKHLIRINTPGVTTADLSRMEYHHRRRPMFPFEPETAWEPR